MDKKKIVGISIFIVLILLIIGIKVVKRPGGINNLTTIYVATGGGKEDFLADPDVLKILKNKYKIVLTNVFKNANINTVVRQFLKMFV